MLLPAALLACAAGVAPATMNAVVRVESGGNPLAVHVNKWPAEQPRPQSVTEAVAVTRRFMGMGYSVDIGLAQLNSQHLGTLGYSVAEAFDPCRNLAASGMILSSFYGKAVGQFGEGQRALMAALSGYNTGSLVRGFHNGYVAKYYINADLPAGSAEVKRERRAFTPREFGFAEPLGRAKRDSRFDTMVAYDRPGYSIAIQ